MSRTWRHVPRPSSAPSDVERVLVEFARRELKRLERESANDGGGLIERTIRTEREVGERLDYDEETVRGIIDLRASADLAFLRGDYAEARILREHADRAESDAESFIPSRFPW